MLPLPEAALAFRVEPWLLSSEAGSEGEIMHIAMLVVAGLVLLAIMHFGPRLIGASFDGAKAFLWVWLVISILNGFYGHFRAGIPALNEIGAFIPIFLIPAAIAFYLTRRAG
jgi:hypothetical protein